MIPVLLLEDEGMVKTVRFADAKYVGDPVNVINLFNRFEVDEIVLLGIDVTREGIDPPYALIEELANECWVPLAYGGGIRDVEQARRVLALGIEKVIVGTAAAESPALVEGLSATFGAQAVVVSVDVRHRNGAYGVHVRNGRENIGVRPETYAQRMEELGAGEILLNSIDRDGTMAGFDLDLIAMVAGAVGIPVVACGGAGDRAHLAGPIRAGASAVGAGSLFVYQGPERGVLVNFPERDVLENLMVDA